MKMLLSIWAISICITTGHALSCIECSTSSSTTCTGNNVTCPSGFVCKSFYSGGRRGESTFLKETTRSCAHPSGCNMKTSMSINEIRFNMASSCCDTDNCSPSIPELSPISSVPNGVTCPSFMAIGANLIQSSGPMTCTGDQNQCAIMEGNGEFVALFRGCATKSFCDVGSQTDTSSILRIRCHNGDISIHRAVLTPVVVSLLLVKWLF
ncbi:uncharacterized protein [Phyllobates terribilis]|uniref:uncharacterized protein n=1 Tax=Phyllobates terribilis TaxID=111132 RepID=UPI003CCAFF86